MDSSRLHYRFLATLTVLFTICSWITGTLSKSCAHVTCSPGYQIRECDRDGESYQCEQCEIYKIQPLNVSSKDHESLHRCFGAPDNNVCGTVGVINSRWRDNGSCKMPCECDVANCYAGKTACNCTKYKPCGVNEQMNSTTGACEPCPPGKEKKEPGCYPCQHVYTISTTNQTVTMETPHGTTGLTLSDTESNIPDDGEDAGMKTEPVEVGDTNCIDKGIAFTVLGVLLCLMVLVEPPVLFAIYRYRQCSKTSQINSCPDEKKANVLTIIQESSLLLNIKDNNINTVREMEETTTSPVNIVNQRNSQGDQIEKTVNNRTIEEEPTESGFCSRSGDTNMTSATSRLIQETSTCFSPFKKSMDYLATGPPLPTEHDEESTHVKYISE